MAAAGGSNGNTRGGIGLLKGAALGAAGVLAADLFWRLAVQARTPDKSVRAPVSPRYSVRDDQFLRGVGAVLPPPFLGGNRVQTLLNGVEIFPAMLEAIRSAERTINLETFIYWSGDVGREFARALAERSRAGVRCHVMLDWLGSEDMDPGSLELMRSAGVQVMRYHKRAWKVQKFNHRTHRKILVCDGRVAFTGGVGIADEWSGDAQDECHWRDNQYRVEGPVVAQLQSAFVDNWLKSQHVVFHDEDYFPHLEPRGQLACQAFQSSVSEGSESLRLMFLLAMGAARRSIRISTAYFVPDDVTVQSLVRARQRGVEIDIIIPGKKIDKRVVRRASRAHWPPLVEAGVRIHEFQPTMYHNKAMIVDDVWTSVGSPNFDNRSFRLNDEVLLNVYDEGFARSQIPWYEHDLGRARLVTTADLHRRSAGERAVDRAAGAVSEQL